jgi:hypothetical protein
MAEDEKVPDDKQCVASEPSSQSPRRRAQDALPGILGKQLRAAYGELLSAPIPDAITDLVKRLERQEAEASTTPPKKQLREEQGQ